MYNIMHISQLRWDCDKIVTCIILSENRLRWLNALLGQFLQSHLFVTKLWFWYAFKFSREYSQAFTNKWNSFQLSKPAQKALVVMSRVMMLVSPVILWWISHSDTRTFCWHGGNDGSPGSGVLQYWWHHDKWNSIFPGCYNNYKVSLSHVKYLDLMLTV